MFTVRYKVLDNGVEVWKKLLGEHKKPLQFETIGRFKNWMRNSRNKWQVREWIKWETHANAAKL